MQARINGNDLHYLDEGPVEAIPVVLLHGMTFDHRMWYPQISLLKHKFRTIAYDLRGHGKSGVGDGQYTYRLFVSDLVALLDHLGIERGVLCGLSMGGAIALRSMELHGERVCGLILCNTSSYADNNQTKCWRERTIESIKQQGLEPFAREFVRAVFASSSFKSRPDTIELIHQMILSSSPLGIAGALLAQAARTDTTAVLAHIKVPTLIVVGSQDTAALIEAARVMHQMIPGSELRIIADAAHISNLENPEDFGKYVLEFLNRLH